MESTLYERADVQLIETLGWDGQDFARLPLHLGRLGASARLLGYPCDPRRAASALRAAAVANAPARLRLTLAANGDINVQSAPLTPAKPVWNIGLAAQRLTSTDPYLRVKSTHRPAYDAARAALPAGLDEVILLNERGQVCDGSITTLFFDRGQGLRTPPLSCGVLPGVLRAELAAPEEMLDPADLPQLRLWVGNSLRGLIAARWGK